MTGHILIVDDEPGVRDVLTRFLSRAGFAVKSAADGEEALALAKQDAPRLVLCDMTMPGMGGLALLRELKKALPKVPVIMVTGVGEESQAKKAMELGAADYVPKPVDFDYLTTSVKANLAGT